MTTDGGYVQGASLAHDLASLDELEAATVESQRDAVAALAAEPGVSEALVLQTCNRVEAYVVVGDDETGRAALEPLYEDVPGDLVRWLDHEESLRHLLRVAAGLESQILGEDEILGQLKTALANARAADAIGPILGPGAEKAIHLGERARSETAINEGALSIASAAVREAAAARDLADAAGLVVGAGEMGRQAATSLSRAVDRLLVANRTLDRAEHVADSVDGVADALPLSDLTNAVGTADVVVTATGSPDPVIDGDTLRDAGETFVVDIAQPRDVAPGAADGTPVQVRSLDQLEAHTAETRRLREAAASGVEEMIETEFERLMTQYKRRRADQVISAMYAGAERIKAEEVDRALGKLDLDEGDAAVVEAMADSIVGQLLAPPTDSLRDAAEADDWSTIHTAIQLFDPSDIDAEAFPSPSPSQDVAIPDSIREDLPQAVREQLED